MPYLWASQIHRLDPASKQNSQSSHLFNLLKSFKYIQKPEEIEILYANNVLVCIDGCNMYHYFRMARKYAASGLDDHNEINELISSLSLDFKIWHLNNQDCLTDFVSSGLTSENRFDQLFAACMIGMINIYWKKYSATHFIKFL